MKKWKKLLKSAAVFLTAMVLTSGISSVVACAETPYRTYTVDGNGRMQETQSAYLAHDTIIKFGDEFLSAPNDIFVDENGTIYVADTGSKRVIVGNKNGELISVIGEGVLQSPRGVFVTAEKHIYVADRDGNAVYVFDQAGNQLEKYGKPDSPLYGESMDFLPSKLVVNDAGVMYIVCEKNTNGIVEISPTDGGTFLGYFGTNFAKVDLQTIIYRAIMTEEQLAKQVSNIPSTPDNLAIDEKGLIYTVTRGEEITTLKRLNIAGSNMIKGNACQGVYDDTPAAVVVGNHDNVYVASQSGYIYEYNKQGEPIFVFGGQDDGTQRIGLSTLVTSIQIDSNDNIYTLDSEKSQIQVFQPTEFTGLLHKALFLYSKGRYTESKEPLQQVLDMNSMFDYANRAMGRAYFQETNFDSALKYARLAKDKDGYSDAFWEKRNEWLKNNIVAALLLIVALVVIWKILKFIDKKKNIFDKPREWKKKMGENRVLSNLAYAKYYMRHPFDASYGIAREGRASWSASSIILVAFMIVYVVNKYLCGFLQKTVRDGKYEIPTDIGTIIVVMVGLTLCNYLVCTINEGEGTIKKIYTYFCYSLLPYVIFTPISFVLSHVLTTNEAFLITLVEILMYGWIVVIGILGIKEVNNYTGKETFKIICLTIFTIVIVALLIFIIYILWAQVFEFISAIFGEVVYRLGY